MKVIILAGGEGKRLWPISRKNLPKQFLKIGDKYSLFQKTILRFLNLVNPNDILIITNKDYKELINSQLSSIENAEAFNVILEPEKKNTAPAITLAMKFLEEKTEAKPNEEIIISSSDHYIESTEEFIKNLQTAVPTIQKGDIVIFGVTPTKPETAYGYIEIDNSFENGIFSVKSFKEKPSLLTAQTYLKNGNFLWNCGIFGFTINSFFQEIKQYCEEIFNLSQLAYEEILEKFFLFPEISIDYILIEKTNKLKVVMLTTNWSDIGSWDSIYDIFSKDTKRNVKIGNVVDFDTKNCLIFGGKRIISSIGLSDIIVIDTDDVLMILKRGESQKIKDLLNIKEEILNE